MANILDYLDWRGDLTLAQDPFNEVDNLILAELSFVDFGGIVPGPGEGRAVPLWKAAEAYFAKTEGRPIDMGVLVPNQIPELLRRTAASPRFRDMKLNGFVDHLDTEKAEQFAALTTECGDGTVYLSFRGTDDTLAGWKEDFYLSCMREVPAQKMAVTYTEAMAHQYPRIKLRLGGHSKGGNLAVYAAAFVGEDVQERILNVFNNDGPGHDLATLESAGYRRIEKKLQTFIPKSSIIGMLLEHGDDYRIVDSDAHGLWQHNPYSWQLNGEDFVYLQHTTASSDRMNESIRQWLNHMDVEKRRRFTDTVYEVLSASEVRSVGQLISDFRSSLPSIIAATKNLDPEEKHMLAELATQFVRVASVQYGQLAREQLGTARAYMSALREKKVDVSAWLEKLREDKGE